MIDNPIVFNVFKWTLWFVLMILIMGWLGRSRFKKTSLEDTNRLRHPISTLIDGNRKK